MARQRDGSVVLISAHLVEFANAHNKLITGGSDYHGENKPDIQLNKMQVDDKYKILRDAK